MGSQSYTSNRQDGSPSYEAVVRGVATTHVKHAGKQCLVDELREFDLLPESCSRVVDDRRRAMNCFDLKEQLHW
jgi:hypothetical protein